MTSTSPRPIGSGDSFTYQGTFAESQSRQAPCPYPTATANGSLTSDVTDSATTAPNSQPGVTSQSVEKDAFPTYTVQTSTDSLLQESATQALLYSTDSQDSNGNEIVTDYTSAQVIDELPESSGQAWSNSPAGTVNETFSDGTSNSRTVNSDGSYTENDTQLNGGTPATITVNSDGSGTYDVFGQFDIVYAAPSGGNIVATITTVGPAPTPTPKTRNIPEWFPTPVQLYSDNYIDNGFQTFDTACHVPNSVTSQTGGDQIVETVHTTDPVLGYTETRTTAWYDVAGIGPACVTINDAVDQYYDYGLDTQRIDYQTTDGNPLQTDTIAEAMWLSAAPTVNAIHRHGEATGIAPSFIANRVAGIALIRARQREQELKSLGTWVSAQSHGAAR